jgi:lysophospholipase L1-like esterase
MIPKYRVFMKNAMLFLISLLFFLSACEDKETLTLPDRPFLPPVAFSFLALGDSYTIGESVDSVDRFPVQLVDSLKKTGLPFGPIHFVARTGWTTSSLKTGIATGDLPESRKYELVSLLIGVNNQYTGGSLETYRKELDELLDTAIERAYGEKERVIVLSIPDYSVTPFGQQRPDPAADSMEIDLFNAVKDSLAEVKGVSFFNITPISREAANDPSLLANDQLHPSGEMYRQWVHAILPDIIKLFN